ncbi:MAG: hypothetical protein Q9193_000646 [Seirophora villosa]
METESLLPGSGTFTLERIQSQLQEDTFYHNPNTPDRDRSSPAPFICESLRYSFSNGLHHYYTKEQQLALREQLCHNLLLATANPDDHCSQLDHLLSQILVCNLQPDDEADKISCRAFQLLTRLPARPLPLPKESIPYNPDYLSARSQQSDSSDPDLLWYDLKVTSFVSVNVIRTALLSVIYRGSAPGMSDEFLDSVANLLTTASTLSSLEQSQSVRQRWFIVRAFLWTCWQRCNMIYFNGILGRNLKMGYNDHQGRSFILDGMEISPDLSIQEMSRNQASRHKPRYMCGWAFELLRSHPVCIGLDFRRFFSRYSMTFGAMLGRCIEGQPEASCPGDEPDRCQRFKGMRIRNQSAHDISCDGTCERLFWDEVSYRSVSGARAVNLGDSDSCTSLLYRSASPATLAISHVWSHGQGGRPERGPLEQGHGLNRCLHRRYVSIAGSLGCDSYWMDTPCIPEEYRLRREAIEKINEVFEHSKVTLVCDKDLMAIDASHINMEARELILATVLVCDWNIRAWTFLEAFRGRSNVHVLCDNNVVVSLKETVEVVYEEGAVDIALLLLSAPHLLPSQITREFENIPMSPFINGFLSVETAGSLLSHRAVSRPGDDIVIWSLLLHDDVYNDAEAFWRSREGYTLSTAFLVSSAPRLLKTKGLTWAPASPTAQITQQKPDGPQTRLLAYDGAESEVGQIQKDGFLARWLMYDFTGSCIGARMLSSLLKVDVDPEHPSHHGNLHAVRHRYLRGFCWGALLRPPASHQFRDDAASHRSDARRVLVVVCATNNRLKWPWDKDNFIRWRWRGVYEWDRAEPLPVFTRTEDILIV